MKIDKILFVGLGGAGQRHLRIFRQLLPDETEFSTFRSVYKTPLLNNDFSINKSQTLEEKYDLKLFHSLEEGLDNNPDLIVISNPTALHFGIAKKAAERNINIFIEKPFSNNLSGFDDFKKVVLTNNLYFFVSFQRRFHTYLKKIKDLISSGELGKIISANFNVCSYVPSWHTYEDFNELYACRNDLGGGVLLTEIHEIDLCYWYFGLPESVYCTGGNYSGVKMDVEDTVHVSLKYNDFVVQINMCFMQKHNRRDLYIAGTKGYLEWNMDDNKLIFNNYESNDTEILTDHRYTNDDLFLQQAHYFLGEFSCSDNTYLDAAEKSLLIVEAAKKSMRSGIAIKMEIV